MRPSISCLLASLVLAAPAAAQLHVGASDANAYVGDPLVGGFEVETAVSGPITAMAQIGNDLMVASDGGFVYAYGFGTGLLENIFHVATDATDMLVHDGTLLISGSDGVIHRVNPITGEMIETFDTGFEIAALALDGDILYAGTPFGVFNQMDLAAERGFTFAGLCGGPINSIISTGTLLYLGDTTGNVYVFDKETEFVTYAYTVSNDATSIVADGDHFLIGGSDGTILRVLPPGGAVAATFNVPSGVGDLILETADSALVSDRTSLSLVTGGDAELRVNLHDEVPGDTYWVLGSIAGKSPGVLFGDVLLELVPDIYTVITLQTPFEGPIHGSFGTVDADGDATATLSIPAGSSPALAGVTIYHASIVASLDAPNLIVDATNVVGLSLEL